VRLSLLGNVRAIEELEVGLKTERERVDMFCRRS
jgi:hypothetical protein